MKDSNLLQSLFKCTGIVTTPPGPIEMSNKISSDMPSTSSNLQGAGLSMNSSSTVSSAVRNSSMTSQPSSSQNNVPDVLQVNKSVILLLQSRRIKY